jgi:tricorn protease
MRIFTICLLVMLQPVLTQAQVDARLFRYPDLSATQISFVYGGDVWVVAKTGGTAMRITSSTGEESFPRFSPDGKTLAFTATYRGNADVYTMPAAGGVPTRLTWHAMMDRVVDWHPDGKRILFASQRENNVGGVNQLYLVSGKGGLPEKLPMPYGELASYAPDGNRIAYVTRITENYPFKRIRSGLASDVIVFDLRNMKAENITGHPAADGKPAWVKNKIYYVSDADAAMRRNIWVYDLGTREKNQLTRFKDIDVNYMSAGPEELVFEAGGKLYLLNTSNNQYTEVKIQVVTDFASLMPRVEQVGTRVAAADLSPDGKRVVAEARGELFSLPAENGPVMNLTNSSGAFDQNPAWSPNGRWIASWSDESGEYNIWLQDQKDGSRKQLTNFSKGMGWRIFWSPNGKQIAFINHLQEITTVSVPEGTVRRIGKTELNSYSALRGFSLSWSPDNQWIAYSKAGENLNSAIYLINLPEKKEYKLTAGYYNDQDPVFDAGGKYLYFLTDRKLQPLYSSLDATWVYPNATQVAYASLDPLAKSLLAAKNDEVKMIAEEAQAKTESSVKTPEPAKAADAPKPNAVVRPEGFESRVQILPVPAGNYASLGFADGKLIYHRFPASGSSGEQSALYLYDAEKKEEKRIMANVNGYAISGDGKSILVMQGPVMGIVKAAPEQKIDKPLRTSAMEMTLDPKKEWDQIFQDTWRRYRDFFYDPAMQQVNWEQMRKQYGSLMEHAITRWDVTNIQAEMIAELAAGHTYARLGDVESASNRGHGFLGIDWELSNGAYRIKRIVRPASWDHEVRSPFDVTGVNVKEGDYILSVNGRPVDMDKEPYAAFDGLSGSSVLLKVNSQPSMAGARDVLVETLTAGQERRLRHLEWIEANRKTVDEQSKGTIGYMYMPNTGGDGQTELMRQFYAQVDKEGFIIDERFNAGGQLGDRFLEMLNRSNLYNIAWRNAGVSRIPGKGNDGPKAMLINGQAGSGGDAFPWGFKTMNMGPIIGERTLGILVGPATGHNLIDGGGITVPDARLYGPDGKWFAEGVGVTPTIEVWDDPAQLARGNDPQLIRAVEEVKKLIQQKPRKLAPKPAFENRTAEGLKDR